MPVITRTVTSPIGPLLLVGDGERLSGLFMTTHRRPPTFHGPVGDGPIDDDAAFEEAASQLQEWFDGARRSFELDLAPGGSAFQRDVWDALHEIPFGETATYGEIAARVGRPGSARAIGHAVGRNPIGIVVPCHRVVGANGTLTGYAGGLDKKRWLLEHERRVAGVTLV